MSKTLLFDFDGTIADTLPKVIELYNEVCENYGGRQLNVQQVDRLRKMGPNEILQKINIPAIKLPFLINRMRGGLKKDIHSIAFFDGIQTVLKTLKEKGIKLGLITSNSSENIALFLKNNKLDVFDFIHAGSGMSGKHFLIKEAIKHQRLNPDTIIYIGDEVRDIMSCRKVPVKIGCVAWGYNHIDILKAHKPDYLFLKPNDILAIL